MTQVEAVILGLDPAKHTSGAGLLVPDYGGMNEEPHPFRGEYVLQEFGKVVSQAERERYIESLLDTALELKLPPVVAAEAWDPPRHRRVRLPGGEITFALDQKWTYETILGIGEGWGRWSAEIEAANEYLAEEKLPAIIVVRFTPNEWRDALFGTRRAKDSEALKATAERYFETVFGYRASSDISEAGCIALCASTSSAVADTVAAWGRAFETKKPKTKKRRRAA